MPDLIARLAEKAARNSRIEQHWYRDYNIKRGLRNEDGTGVKTILTEISDVQGYKKEGEEIVPVEGRLIYRGVEIKDVVEGFQKDGRFGFEETAYLLMFGELPTEAELDDFSHELVENRRLPHDFVEHILLPFPIPDIMNKLMINVAALYRIDTNHDDTSIDNVIRQCISLIAKFPTVVAYSLQTKGYQEEKSSLIIHEPNCSLSTAQNFLYMLREDKAYTPLEAKTLDMMLVLHADHSGGNNSTFTDHCVTSTGTDTYSAIVAALASLKGPKHGGANARVMAMMDDIKTEVDEWENDAQVADYLTKILRKEAGDGSGLVYGMGHAVYKKSDPRAVLLEGEAEKLAAEKGRLEEFRLYGAIARLTAEVMSKLKGKKVHIAPNVDFYSGFVYDLLGFPREIYTALFAMARVAGWSAHRIERLLSDDKIIRPASIYVGPTDRHYVPLAERS